MIAGGNSHRACGPCAPFGAAAPDSTAGHLGGAVGETERDSPCDAAGKENRSIKGDAGRVLLMSKPSMQPDFPQQREPESPAPLGLPTGQGPVLEMDAPHGRWRWANPDIHHERLLRRHILGRHNPGLDRRATGHAEPT